MISLKIYSVFKLLDLLIFFYEAVLLLIRILFVFILFYEFILGILSYISLFLVTLIVNDFSFGF